MQNWPEQRRSVPIARKAVGFKAPINHFSCPLRDRPLILAPGFAPALIRARPHSRPGRNGRPYTEQVYSMPRARILPHKRAGFGRFGGFPVDLLPVGPILVQSRPTTSQEQRQWTLSLSCTASALSSSSPRSCRAATDRPSTASERDSENSCCSP